MDLTFTTRELSNGTKRYEGDFIAKGDFSLHIEVEEGKVATIMLGYKNESGQSESSDSVIKFNTTFHKDFHCLVYPKVVSVKITEKPVVAQMTLAQNISEIEKSISVLQQDLEEQKAINDQQQQQINENAERDTDLQRQLNENDQRDNSQQAQIDANTELNEAQERGIGEEAAAELVRSVFGK